MSDQNYYEDEIDLMDYILVIWKFKWLIIGVIIATLLGSAIYLYHQTDIYEAKASIMPLQGKRSYNIPFFAEKLLELDALKDIISANLPVVLHDPATILIQSVLASREFNVRIVEKYNLSRQLFENLWDDKKKEWICNKKKDANKLTVLERIIGNKKIHCPPTSIDGAKLLEKKFTVDLNPRKSKWIELKFEDKNPSFAATMLNRYLKELDSYLRNQEIERAIANSRYLKKLLLSQKNEEVKKGLARVLTAQHLTIMYARGISDFAFKITDHPLTPETPVKPRRHLTLLLSFIVSLFLGIFLAFFMEYIRNVKKKWAEGSNEKKTSEMEGCENLINQKIIQ
ncbi:putative Polysaccharide chain length determinant N-terminal domain-containing protein [Candidatus Magnetomoraceae bacterium gMMP-15]